MDRTLKCDYSLKSCRAVLDYDAVCSSIFAQFVILENLSVLDLALLGVKGLTDPDVFYSLTNVSHEIYEVVAYMFSFPAGG